MKMRKRRRKRESRTTYTEKKIIEKFRDKLKSKKRSACFLLRLSLGFVDDKKSKREKDSAAGEQCLLKKAPKLFQ